MRVARSGRHVPVISLGGPAVLMCHRRGRPYRLMMTWCALPLGLTKNPGDPILSKAYGAMTQLRQIGQIFIVCWSFQRLLARKGFN